MKPRIVFMGTPDFALPALDNLITGGSEIVGVVCQPDRPRGRRLQPAAPPVKILAQKNNLPVFQPLNLRRPEFFQQLAELRPDLIVTAAYGKILPPEILDLPEYGCLNIHASLLPAYRGAAPVNWVLINGEKQTGVTIMLMDEGLDTGDILAQESVRIAPDANAGEITDALALLGAKMLPQVIEQWLAGDIDPKKQDVSTATYAPMMQRKTGEIDWTAPAEAIHNLIRGTYPWPGAYTWCSDKRMKIHKARVSDNSELIETAKDKAPGTICLCGAMSISVACGTGVIDLLEIQTESGRRMHCRDCAHNYKFGQKMGGRQK